MLQCFAPLLGSGLLAMESQSQRYMLRWNAMKASVDFQIELYFSMDVFVRPHTSGWRMFGIPAWKVKAGNQSGCNSADSTHQSK